MADTQITLGLDTRPFTQGLDQASSSMERYAGLARRVGGQVQTALVGGVAAVSITRMATAGIADYVESSVSARREMVELQGTFAQLRMGLGQQLVGTGMLSGLADMVAAMDRARRAAVDVMGVFIRGDGSRTFMGQVRELRGLDQIAAAQERRGRHLGEVYEMEQLSRMAALRAAGENEAADAIGRQTDLRRRLREVEERVRTETAAGRPIDADLVDRMRQSAIDLHAAQEAAAADRAQRDREAARRAESSSAMEMRRTEEQMRLTARLTEMEISGEAYAADLLRARADMLGEIESIRARIAEHERAHGGATAATIEMERALIEAADQRYDAMVRAAAAREEERRDRERDAREAQEQSRRAARERAEDAVRTLEIEAERFRDPTRARAMEIEERWARRMRDLMRDMALSDGERARAAAIAQQARMGELAAASAIDLRADALDPQAPLAARAGAFGPIGPGGVPAAVAYAAGAGRDAPATEDTARESLETQRSAAQILQQIVVAMRGTPGAMATP